MCIILQFWGSESKMAPIGKSQGVSGPAFLLEALKRTRFLVPSSSYGPPWLMNPSSRHSNLSFHRHTAFSDSNCLPPS